MSGNDRITYSSAIDDDATWEQVHMSRLDPAHITAAFLSAIETELAKDAKEREFSSEGENQARMERRV